MRINLRLTLAAAGLALFSGGFATAAVTPSGLIEPVLEACPIDEVAGCADAVATFVASRPAEAALNDELADLVAALAYAADHPNMTLDMCIELQRGIRVAGAAVTLPAPRQAIKGIADSLCDDVSSVTGSLTASSNGGDGSSSGASSSGGSSGGGSSSGGSSSGGSSSGGSSSGGSSSGGSSSGGSSSGGDIPIDID